MPDPSPRIIFLSHSSRIRAAEIAVPLADSLPACCTESFDAPFLAATNAIFFQGDPATSILTADIPETVIPNDASWGRSRSALITTKNLEYHYSRYFKQPAFHLLAARIGEPNPYYDTLLVEDAFDRWDDVSRCTDLVGRHNCLLLNLDKSFATFGSGLPEIINYSMTPNFAADITALVGLINAKAAP
jgi:hypothetical protein